jgi:Flp pilus assembly protein TadB
VTQEETVIDFIILDADTHFLAVKLRESRFSEMRKFETRRLMVPLVACASLMLLTASQAFSVHARQRHSTRHVVLCSLPRKARSDTDSTKTSSAIVKLEQEVLESTRRRLDLQSVLRIFDRTERQEEMRKSHSSNWNVALAAGTVAAGVSFTTFHSLAVSGVMMVAVFFVALRDPLEEDSVAGK